MKKPFYLLILLSFISIKTFACYAIIVGKKASADGSVLVGHLEQNGPPAYLNFIAVPRIQHSPSNYVEFYKGGKYPETVESYAYLWSENFGMHGSDGIMNEYGVICVSDATHTREDPLEKLIERGDITNGGVTLEIRIEIARRAKSARQAIKIAADLISKFGYNGAGGTHIIADPNEAWLFTALPGKRWIAQRVPDDKVVVLPNVNIIREINLKDTINFFAAPDIIEYAIKRGWYNPKKDGNFDFKKAYDKERTNWFWTKYGCDARQWRGQCLITGKTIKLPVKEDLPFYVNPAKKLTVADLRQYLSDHLEGSEFDKSSEYKKSSPHKILRYFDGAVCHKDIQELAIFQLRSWLPLEIGCIYWRTTAAPCSSVLTPWYLGITETHPAYNLGYDIKENVKYSFHFNPPAGTFEYKADKAFWLFNSVENLIDDNYEEYYSQARAIYDPFEIRLYAQQKNIENNAIELYKKNPKICREFLTSYCKGLATDAMDLAKQLEQQLRTKVYGY